LVEHVDIPEGEIHEPKGVSLQDAGRVYISDGAGSGTWTDWPTGWAYYQDNGAAQVFNTTASKLSIDGAGSLTDETKLPLIIRGTGSLWNTTTDKITPIETGDTYDLRFDFPVTAESASPTQLTVEFDIGLGGSPSIVILERFLATGKTTPYTLSFGFPLLALTDTTTNNGIQVFCKTDTGTVTITNPSVTIVRNHPGSI